MGLWNAMNQVISLGLHNVTFESDSKILVDAIHSKGVEILEFSFIVSSIR